MLWVEFLLYSEGTPDGPTTRLTGRLLIIVPLAFTLCFTLLQLQFEYPDILRQPTADVLTKFQAGGPGLVAVWYVPTLTAVLFILGAVADTQPPQQAGDVGLDGTALIVNAAQASLDTRQ